MFDVRVDIFMKGVLARLDRLAESDRILQQSLKPYSQRLLSLYQANTPVSQEGEGRRPGLLKAGWSSEIVKDSPQVFTLRVLNKDPRAPYLWPLLQQGAAPHMIRARYSRLLSFRFRGSDESFVGPAVRHPGFPIKVRSATVDNGLKEILADIRSSVLDALIKS